MKLFIFLAMFAPSLYAAEVYKSPKEFMVKVVENGHIKGLLDTDSQLSRLLEKHLNSKMQAELEGDVVYEFNESCKRIKMKITKPLDNSKYVTEFEVNMCLDGSPPAEGMNLAELFETIKKRVSK